MKKFKGNPPSGSWTRVGEVEDDESSWGVFVQQQPNPAWQTIKLCAVEPVVGKGNFWMAWNPSQQRFGNGADTFKLMQHRPSLVAQVQLVLTDGSDLL